MGTNLMRGPHSKDYSILGSILAFSVFARESTTFTCLSPASGNIRCWRQHMRMIDATRHLLPELVFRWLQNFAPINIGSSSKLWLPSCWWGPGTWEYLRDLVFRTIPSAG